MKILFTGSTAKQVCDDAHKRARVKRIDDCSIICNSLRKQGFDIDRRRVEWGEDLSEYGLAIIGLGPFGSPNTSKQIFKALYAMSAVKNVIVFYEDWKINEVISSYKNMLTEGTLKRHLSKKWSNGSPFYLGVDNPNFNTETVKEQIQNVIDGKFDALIPAFDWGNKEIIRKVIKSKNIFNLDLTPYVLENWDVPLTVEQKPKMKKHMLASLASHTRWVDRLNLQWDVDYYGAKSIKSAPLLATETDVFNKCGEYWSILCPRYPTAGSGWFRIRWIYSAIWKSIIIPNEKDSLALGLPHYDNIEIMSDDELKHVAEEQAEAILKHIWTKEDFDNKLKEIVLLKGKDLTILESPQSVEASLETFFN